MHTGVDVARASVVILALLAVVQGAVLLNMQREEVPTRTSPLVVGEPAAEIRGTVEGTGDTVLRLGDTGGKWTAVLAFYSDCSYCDRAAAHWRSWLARDRDLRTWGVTRDGLDEAVEYARGHDWALPILSVRPSPGSLEHQLISRTPWVFLFDPGGTLRYEGNGSNLSRVDSVMKMRKIEGQQP